MKFIFKCKVCDAVVFTHISDSSDGIGIFRLDFKCTNCHRDIKKDLEEVYIKV